MRRVIRPVACSRLGWSPDEAAVVVLLVASRTFIVETSVCYIRVRIRLVCTQALLLREGSDQRRFGVVNLLVHTSITSNS